MLSDIFERFFHQNGGCYIVKPAALSCGRGIYVTDDINDIALHGLDENVSVSQYIANPLLLESPIDENKFSSFLLAANSKLIIDPFLDSYSELYISNCNFSGATSFTKGSKSP